MKLLPSAWLKFYEMGSYFKGNDFGSSSVYFIKRFPMEYSTTEFETLYIQCFPPSMRLAMSLLHEEDGASDVVQEVFLKLWESGKR